MTFVSPATETGLVMPPPEPLPSCPYWSLPMDETVPVVTAWAAPVRAIGSTESTETSNTPARRSRLTEMRIRHPADVVEGRGGRSAPAAGRGRRAGRGEPAGHDHEDADEDRKSVV